MDGLWKVERVTMGEMSMTPIGRWIALAPDQTQVSGNGYLRHSNGVWKYNPADSTLLIEDYNGIDEGFGPFKVDYKTNNMSWTREENGEQINVILVRANDIPAAPSDSLVGLWDLATVIQNGKDVSMAVDSSNTAYLHLRWDRNFRQTFNKDSDSYGVYQPHGHRTTVYFINNNSRDEYSYEFNDEDLILSLTNPEDTVSYIFERSNEFPE